MQIKFIEDSKNFHRFKKEYLELLLFDSNGDQHICKISHIDAEKALPIKWRVQKNTDNYYVVVSTVKGTTLTMGKFLISPNKGFDCDHVNRNTLDNRRENLRAVTRTQNCHNRGPGISLKKYKGVHMDKTRNKWCAQIRVNGKTKNIGRFVTAEEAAYAYNQEAIKNFGEYAFINKI